MTGLELRSALEVALGARFEAAQVAMGGDINEAYQVRFSDGRVVFVKTHPRADARLFPTEARGLAWLAEARALRVPQVLAFSAEDVPGPRFLVLEWLRRAERVADFDERLGRGLAALHRVEPPGFGLDHDNFIGRLPQVNTPAGDWAEFYAERRLRPQLRLARDAGHLDSSLAQQLGRLIDVLPTIVGPPEPPARLHGDLWGGNLHVDERGEPVLIDPAVYGGHREVDLAMMKLFGGFGPRVFAAYDEAYPLAPEHEDRVPLYQLYPLLVHVNLFNGSYVGSLRQAVSRLTHKHRT